MTQAINELNPQSLWQNFWQISQIPRLSGNEREAIKFLEKFAKDLGLDVVVSQVGNVLIRKPAAPGLENYPTVVLQSHLDMVGQKDDGVQHDFTKDPIKMVIDGDWVRAEGTTLGADDGIGVAAAMAILQAKDIKHGPIEAIFTVDEEVGSTGALAVSPDLLSGKILLNLDGEEEGKFIIGCAGCLTTRSKIKYAKVGLDNNTIAFNLEVKGLRGGHSGVDIHLNRGNANQVIGWVLGDLAKKIELRLSSIQGGEFIGAIATKASAIITLPQQQENEFKQLLDKLTGEIKAELELVDPNLTITAISIAPPAFLLDKVSQNNILNLIYTYPNGIFKMSDEMPGIVGTSNNFSKIIFTDDTIEVLSKQRSFIDSQLERISNIISQLSQMADAEVDKFDLLPGWKPEPNSSVVKYINKKFNTVFGIEPQIFAIHALLECGIFKGKYPDMELISFGPTVENAHSTRERVDIASVKRFWDFLVLLLEGVNEIK
jgi:dipeptidase D